MLVTVSPTSTNLYNFNKYVCTETSMGISMQDVGPFQKEYRQTVHNMGKIIINR